MAELELLDWKRHIFELYAQVRANADREQAWELWRSTRERLFRSHPQSPIAASQRAAFAGLPMFEYDARFAVLAQVAERPRHTLAIPASSGDGYRFTRFAQARFELLGQPQTLQLYWLEGYGGGVFLPFADATTTGDTYGGGRYLLDTVKGADLGMRGDALVLDFNFAYNPSCAYDPRWACPLAPVANRLPIAVGAGEKIPPPRPLPR